MSNCQFGNIASRQSVYHDDCDQEASYEAVDSQAPVITRAQLPVCSRHARFLTTQAYWIFPAGDDEAASLNLDDICNSDESQMTGT